MSEPELWIVVKNWRRFQHYGNRSPPWIKLYTELNSDPNWLGLSSAARGMLVTIWLEYARSNEQLSARSVLGLCGKSARTAHLESLNEAGFIQLSASRPLAPRARSRETETEKRKKDLPAMPAVASYEGSRQADFPQPEPVDPWAIR